MAYRDLSVSYLQESSSRPELQQLPKETFWDALPLCQIDGFWYYPSHFDTIRAIQSHFEARSDDIILTSSMKTGTTWLKALCHCIMRRSSSNGNHDEGEGDDELLVRNNPHAYVLDLVDTVYQDNLQPDLSGMPSPRLFHAHLPYSALPDSIKNSDCKIVYIARNPKDTLVSTWHYYNKVLRPNQPPFPLEKAVDAFCNGAHVFGPFHEHVAEYWKEHNKTPHRLLFMRYEELKRDPRGQVKRLALFLGRPFQGEAEVDKVLQSCSLDRLKNLDVNKNGARVWSMIPNSAFFRNGVVGDWMNHLSLEMAERIDQLTLKKLEGTGLDLER